MQPRLDAESPFTGDYARDFETWSEYYDSQPELDSLAEHGDFSGKEVLEAGCGSGRLSFRISDDDFSLTSVDIVPSLIDLCHDKLVRDFEGDRTRLRFEVQDLQELPYPENHFDVILDGWTFSTLEDFDEGAAEYKRVLRDDGTLLAIEFREGSPYQRIIDQFVPEDAHDDELPSPDAMMETAFGPPDATEEIVSEYRFGSLQEAFDAFWFNFTEWMDVDLSEAQAESLTEEIKAHRTGERIVIEEYAKLYKYEGLE